MAHFYTPERPAATRFAGLHDACTGARPRASGESARRPFGRTRGYVRVMETVSLKITGMTCSGCVNSVERALERVRGVTKARAQLEKGEATVEGVGLDASVLIAALEDAGYEARTG